MSGTQMVWDSTPTMNSCSLKLPVLAKVNIEYSTDDTIKQIDRTAVALKYLDTTESFHKVCHITRSTVLGYP